MGQRGEGGLSESWASVGKREEREKVGQAGPKKEMGCGKKKKFGNVVGRTRVCACGVSECALPSTVQKYYHVMQCNMCFYLTSA